MRKRLLTREIDTPLSQCQNQLAEMMGFRNWHELHHSVEGYSSHYVEDDLVPVDVRIARREQLIRVLCKNGLPNAFYCRQ